MPEDDIQRLLRIEETKSERLLNSLRLSIAALFLAVIFVAVFFGVGRDIPKQSVQAIVIGAASYFSFSLFMLFYLRSAKSFKAIQYVSTIVDISILTYVLYSFGTFRTFKTEVFLVYFVWIAVAVIRFSPQISLFTGLFSVVSYVFIIALALLSGTIETGTVTESFITQKVSPINLGVKIIVLTSFLIVMTYVARGYRRLVDTVLDSERRYRLLAENVIDVIWTLDLAAMKYTYVSPSVQRFLGYSGEETLLLAPEKILTPSSYEIAMKALEEEMIVEKMADKDLFRSRVLEMEHVKKDGSVVWAEVRMAFLRRPDGKPYGVLGVTRDITDRRGLEDQLRHSQKLEAVGTLTGGIAHDFNNILTIIVNAGNVLQMRMGKDAPLRSYVTQMLSSADRAASLIQSLLTFSRKQVFSMKPVNLNTIVANAEKFMLSLVGEDIEFRTSFADRDLIILADKGQIEQVLMNLTANARDSMAKGGVISISTELVELDNRFLKAHGYGKPGIYALLSVSDTGIGMDEKMIRKIFEPFFTTKEIGKGTGLGLSIVYGIVKQHNGYITCYSEPGKGTTFKIYLPLKRSDAVSSEFVSDIILPRGTETVLFAEDDKELRDITREILEESGYKLVVAGDGEDAINKFKEYKDDIHLLLFDVIMPGKNGMEAYNEIRKIKPDIKVLFISGYAADIVTRRGFLEEGLSFISKPVMPGELLKAIRNSLDS